VRLGNLDCGCGNRKEIMFERGNLGITEAAFMAAVAAMLLTAIVYRRKFA